MRKLPVSGQHSFNLLMGAFFYFETQTIRSLTTLCFPSIQESANGL